MGWVILTVLLIWDVSEVQTVLQRCINDGTGSNTKIWVVRDESYPELTYQKPRDALSASHCTRGRSLLITSMETRLKREPCRSMGSKATAAQTTVVVILPLLHGILMSLGRMTMKIASSLSRMGS